VGDTRFEVVLLDGTYELFRYFAVTPPAVVDGRDVAAARAVARSVLGLIENGTAHVGVATDHVIESFRNHLWPGYKTGAGLDPRLWEQFGVLVSTLAALGVTVWPMVEFEADDALASAAVMAADEDMVERVLIATPDKDLAQCVRGSRVVMLNRRTSDVIDEPGVWAKWGVGPNSIPDWLALVGDSADGFPGLSGWGAKSAATLLARYGSIDAIPADPSQWDVTVRGRDRLSASLEGGRDRAALFRDLATLRVDVPLGTSVTDLRWAGPTDDLADVARSLNAPDLITRTASLTG
jgi:5'-3' exonuclease